jgi:hypothetical protein
MRRKLRCLALAGAVKALGWDGCLLGSNHIYEKEKYQIIHIGKVRRTNGRSRKEK